MDGVLKMILHSVKSGSVVKKMDGVLKMILHSVKVVV